MSCHTGWVDAYNVPMHSSPDSRSNSCPEIFFRMLHLLCGPPKRLVLLVRFWVTRWGQAVVEWCGKHDRSSQAKQALKRFDVAWISIKS